MTKRAAIYCRISDDREGRELGVERQEEDCRLLATRLGLDVVRVYVDNDVSASTRSRKVRPQYQQLLADAQARDRDGNARDFDVVLAYTSSRLTRKPREGEDLIDLAEAFGTRFEYVRSPSFDLNTANGRRIARVMAAVDAGEAEETAERVARAKLQAAHAGQWRGGPRPFGYDADGVTVRADEAAEIARAADMIIAGSSVRSIAADWAERGVLTPGGQQWQAADITKLLMRPRNAGLVTHRGEVVNEKAQWAAVIEPGRWRALMAVLSDPKRRTTPGGQRRWMLSGIARCGLEGCGATVVVSQTGRGRANAKPSYCCREGKHVARATQSLDDFVDELVIARLSRPDAIDLVRRDEVVDTAPLYVTAVALRQRLDELGVLYGKRVLDARQVAAASRELQGELQAVELAIADANRGSIFAGIVDAPDVGAAWKGLDLDRRRTIVQALMTITLYKSRRGRPPGWQAGTSYFDSSTVKVDPLL